MIKIQKKYKLMAWYSGKKSITQHNFVHLHNIILHVICRYYQFSEDGGIEVKDSGDDFTISFIDYRKEEFLYTIPATPRAVAEFLEQLSQFRDNFRIYEIEEPITILEI